MNLDDIANKLVVAARNLNEASDNLGNAIDEFNTQINKLNLGVTCWIKIGEIITLGYCKFNKKWGLCLATKDEQWHFNDAPRELRARGITYITDLLVAMEEESNKLTEHISRFIATIKGVSNE